ncbi:hypothetical protein [Lentzea atacamensis]|uniref:hypothetical protein n=1 Tax=Lentzea atacamensis TaxID=531938 RepID=UPI0011BEB95A|nr:hypothetical protein [Lentzea atacamensis]
MNSSSSRSTTTSSAAADEDQQPRSRGRRSELAGHPLAPVEHRGILNPERVKSSLGAHATPSDADRH